MKFAPGCGKTSAGGRTAAFVLALCMAFAAVISPVCAASAKDGTSDHTESNSTIVKFTDGGISASGVYDGYEIDGTSFTINESGTYVFSGSCSDGNIEVKKELKDVTVVFNGLKLKSTSTAPFNAKSDTEVTVILTAGTSNSLEDTDRNEEKPKSCMNSSGDLKITGSGALSVSGNNKQGIKADGTLEVTGGDLTVSAVRKALKADEKVVIGTEGGKDNDLSITVTSSYEAIESENIYFYSGTVDLTASDDGVNSSSSDDSTTQTTGTDSTNAVAAAVDKMAENENAAGQPPEMPDNAGGTQGGMHHGGFGGGAAPGGMEDQPEVGDFNIHIYGGDITVNAGGDGLDSNGSIYMYGGNVKVFQTGTDDGALDYETECRVTGGTLLAAGSSRMAATPTKTDGGQPYLNFMTGSSVSAGSTINIKDASVNVVYTAKIPVSVQSVIFSSPALKEGSSYTLYEGSSEKSSAEATTESGTGFGGGMHRPDGMTPPEGFDGTKPPELPDGMTPPEDMGNGGRPGFFSDVAVGSWYSQAVEFVTRANIMNGTAVDKFSPDASMTRAMLVTVMWRAEGQPAVSESAENSGVSVFEDITADSWYENAVAWAVENGIVKGTSDKTFSPDKNITRQEIAAILHRYAEFKGADISKTADISSYADSGNVASWAADAVAWAVGNDIITGTDLKALAPSANASRAQTAAMLMRFIENNKIK